jgi:hypothetical protein
LCELQSFSAVEQALKEFKRQAMQQLRLNKSRAERLAPYLQNFNLSFIIPAYLKGKEGWRPEWDDHVVTITPELTSALLEAARAAVAADNAVAAMSSDIVLELS